MRGSTFTACMLMLSGLLCLTGCDQRELCYDHSHVSPVVINFDWSMAPEATPNTMVVWFFSSTTKERYRFELTGNGTSSRSDFDCRIMVRPGSYRVLCHNGTTDNNSENGETFYEYNLVTYEDAVLSPMNRSENAPLPGDADNQPVSRAKVLPVTGWALPKPALRAIRFVLGSKMKSVTKTLPKAKPKLNANFAATISA